MSVSSAKSEKISYANGRETARRIFLEILRAIDVAQAMRRKLRREGDRLIAGDVSISLARPPRVIAIGKAAQRMAVTLEAMLGGGIERGVIVAPSVPAKKPERFEVFAGGHPYPSEVSLAGAEAALKLVSGLAPDDAVIFLLSGGGSALFEKPLDPAIGLADLIEFNRILVTCGMPIEEMNVLRKHLSAVKGGRLALAAWPARQMTIYISDVPDDFASMVASGPTMPDESSLEDCYRLVESRGISGRLPATIRRLFESKSLEETPKPNDSRFDRSVYFRLLSNRDAVEGARVAAERSGFIAAEAAGEQDLDFRAAARLHAAQLDDLVGAHPGKPVALIAGGEVISKVTGKGMGGRNQAYVLSAAQLIEGRERVVMSAATDGRDGNSPSSGAVADGQTMARARTHHLDPERALAESDSYYFFRTLGDTLDTGFIDNNVRDVRVWLAFGSK